MRRHAACFLLSLAWLGAPDEALAAGSGQLSISSPSNGATYSSAANVSTSVTYAYAAADGYPVYLDRRVFDEADSPGGRATDDNCYFLPLRVYYTTGGVAVTGTLRDGAGSPSTSWSSASCFPRGNDATYLFVATLVGCSSGSYSVVSGCLEHSDYVLARSTRYFTHH